jgi:hypothetical protein
LFTGALLPFLLPAYVAAADSSMNQLTTYAAPAGIPANTNFTVKVRSPGGEWLELFCYAVEVDMHQPRTAALAIFDFSGEVEVAVTNRRGPVASARIRPLSYALTPGIAGDTLHFKLTQPRNLSIEVNGDIFENLHLFAGPIDTERPDPQSPDVLYFGPGVHSPGPSLAIPSGKTVYLAGGAVLKTKLVCDRVENVRILGRGILYHPERGIEVTRSRNVSIDGITIVNPRHYTVHGGQSQALTITNLKSFSSHGWSDGIDLMSCSGVLVDGVFLRNSDDCIAIYGHRWTYFGDARDITVRNSTLWADVAHPVNIGTHGNPARPEVIENLHFSNLDILNHDEPQIGYQGCFAINASDANLVRNVRVENVRIEDFEQGQLVSLRVAFNRSYATAPGRGIEKVHFKNITYNGARAGISILAGYDETRPIDGVTFENLRINGRLIRTADEARFFVGEHVRNLEFSVTQ